MKPGVKRDLIFVVILSVAVVGWLVLGLVVELVLGFFPTDPLPTDPLERVLVEESFNEARSTFLSGWWKTGMYLATSGALLYWGHRAVVSRGQPGAAAPKGRPEDSYLSGKAVVIIVGVFVALVIGFVCYMTFASG